MNTRSISSLTILVALLGLQGCAAVAVTGAATGVSAAYDRRTTGTIIEDEAIELKAVKGFFEDKEIRDQAHLNVTSYNTRVLVSGEAPTEELRSRAIDIVRNIDKVSHVYNEVAIAAPSSLMTRSSDSVITSKVKTKLLASEQISGVNVKVVTENGVVFLMGIAPRAEADLATDIARQTGGVQKVVKLFEYLD